MKKYNVAVVGATGNVGREILNILDFRNFPVNKVFALASSKSEGLKVIYGNDKEIEVSNLEKFDFKTNDESDALAIAYCCALRVANENCVKRGEAR